MTVESKQKIENASFGQIINYGRHICYHGYGVGNDGLEKTKMMLFDKNEFWLIAVIRGYVSNVTTCYWTTPRSFDLIRDFIKKPKLMTVLDQACSTSRYSCDEEMKNFLKLAVQMKSVTNNSK
jgi:hypothetical protein